MFLRINPQLCDKCGWCCKNCYPIEVTEEDIKKAGGFRDLEPIKTTDGEVLPIFSLKIPCELLTEDNRCSIYEVRPKSCGSYPLGINEGKNIVQRNPKCGYITNLLLNKVEGWAKRIREIRGEK
jgi:Fe-S-cluster containining protein